MLMLRRMFAGRHVRWRPRIQRERERLSKVSHKLAENAKARDTLLDEKQEGQLDRDAFPEAPIPAASRERSTRLCKPPERFGEYLSFWPCERIMFYNWNWWYCYVLWTPRFFSFKEIWSSSWLLNIRERIESIQLPTILSLFRTTDSFISSQELIKVA